MLMTNVFLMSVCLFATVGFADSWSVNCRRYAFAPACRGMMVKRSGINFTSKSTTTQAEVLAAKYGGEIVDFLLQIQDTIEENKLMMKQLLRTTKQCEKLSNVDDSGENA